MTAGIENQKTKSRLFTCDRHFHISSVGADDKRSELKKNKKTNKQQPRFSTLGWVKTARTMKTTWGWGGDGETQISDLSKFLSTLKKNSKTEEAFRRQLPNTFKYWNIHKRKRDSSSPSPFFFFSFFQTTQATTNR